MHALALGWIVLAVLASGCRMAGPTYHLGPVERLNAEAGKFGRSAQSYSSTISTIDGGGALAVWLRQAGRFQPLVYSRVADGAAPFGGEADLSPDTLRDTVSTVPTLERGTTAGELYAIWQARILTSGQKHIVFRRSEDAGATWSAAQTLNAELTSFGPVITVTRDGAIFGAWTDERGGGRQVFLNRSLDHGRTWLAADVRIDAALDRRIETSSASIASDESGRVVVVWEQAGRGGRSIQAVVSADRGTTWSLPVRVDDGGRRPSPSAPSVVFASGRAIVTWTAASVGTRTLGQVWSDASSDGGLTWGDDVPLHDAAGGVAPRVHLVSDGRTARAVFHAGPRTAAAIFYAETGPDGAWRARGDGLTRVSRREGMLANPRLALDARALYVAYEEDGKRILLDRSTDGGATWGAASVPVYEIEKSQGAAEAHFPQVAATDGLAYVMWEVWSDASGVYRSPADTQKERPMDLYVRRITFGP
jgi:hypothetical protein